MAVALRDSGAADCLSAIVFRRAAQGTPALLADIITKM